MCSPRPAHGRQDRVRGHTLCPLSTGTRVCRQPRQLHTDGAAVHRTLQPHSCIQNTAPHVRFYTARRLHAEEAQDGSLKGTIVISDNSLGLNAYKYTRTHTEVHKGVSNTLILRATVTEPLGHICWNNPVTRNGYTEDPGTKSRSPSIISRRLCNDARNESEGTQRMS